MRRSPPESKRRTREKSCVHGQGYDITQEKGGDEMHYKDIEIFLELVRTRNITKTAEYLYLSQSTISSRLKNLEDEMGCQLIVRAKGRRMIQLTRQGEQFIPVAERWRNLFEETELMRSASLSTLRLAASESTYYEIVAPFLLLFSGGIPISRSPSKSATRKKSTICWKRT